MIGPPGWPATLVLASGSPRRLALLRSIGVDPQVRPADINEDVLPHESPAEYVNRLAIAKASKVAMSSEVVIGADTTVSIDGEILVKPADDDDALRMLRLLSGRTHVVYSAVAVWKAAAVRSVTVSSEVEFMEVDDELLTWYIRTGEPFDKAGGYAVQGSGALLVSRIHGSTTNVIGLPLAELHALIVAGQQDG